MKQLDPTETIAIGFQVQYQLDEGKALAFSSCVDADCDPAVLNRALDKLVDAAERQQARAKLPRLRKELERLEKSHLRAAEDMFRLDEENAKAEAHWRSAHEASGRRGGFKLNPAQVNERNKRDADRTNAEITFKRYAEEIALRKEELATLEGATNFALPSAANSNSSLPNS